VSGDTFRFGRIETDPWWRRLLGWLFLHDCGGHHWLRHMRGQPCITVTGAAVKHGLVATLTEEVLHHVVANLFGDTAYALTISSGIDRIPDVLMVQESEFEPAKIN